MWRREEYIQKEEEAWDELGKMRGVEVPGRGPLNRPAADTTPTGVSVETAVWSARRAGVAASRLGKASPAGAPETRIRHTWGTKQ